MIAAAAMDQRGSLQKSLAKEKGGPVGDAMMEEFKTLVTEVLTPHASAILLDPEWGLPASKRRAKNAGLLLAYEKTGYDKTSGTSGRSAGSLVGSAAERSGRGLRENSALLHAVRSQGRQRNKHAWVERIGDECRANDIPFFWSSLATKKARTKRASSMPRRSRTSSPRACASSPKIGTAWTC